MSIGLWAQLACVWEATARKAGNVHRQRDFDDLTYLDFVVSAAAIAPVFEQAPSRRVGDTVLEGVRATRRVVKTNTNLGILLLLAPLAAVPFEEPLQSGLEKVLAALDLQDSQAVYAAIRLAKPGGLGRVENQDVAEPPTLPLRQIMASAADRDWIARQYANGFAEVLGEGLGFLEEGLEWGRGLELAILFCQLRLLSSHPDTLIKRKRGSAEAAEASAQAQRVLDLGWPDAQAGREAFEQLDAWLRADGHARNPGATADLVTASLFAGLRERIIALPCGFDPPPPAE